MHFSTILVAVDIHDPVHGKAAIARAASLAGSNSQISILYVRYYLPSRYSELLVGDFDQDEQTEALTVLKQWSAQAGLTESQVEIVTRRGPVRDEVLAMAERLKADLIVIGSHQPTISSRLLGSNASAIVHHSQVSVLVVRASSDQ